VKDFKIIVEKHADCYVAYPLGVTGVVVGEGETYKEAMADVKSAIAFHLETFAPPRLVSDLDAAYQQMAQEEQREAEALEWAEATIGDAIKGPTKP